MLKVSVIVPVYNREMTIERTIKSVLKQTFRNFELIIVNDGSVDRSLETVTDYAKKDNRIKIFSQNNSGVSVARNRGIKESLGKYICFLDSDDTYESSFLEKMVATAELNNADVTYSGHFYVYNNKKKPARIKFVKEKIFLNYLKNKTTPHTNSWMIRKSFLKENKILFEVGNNLGEDMLFFSSILCLQPAVAYVKEHLTNYYVDTENSLSKDIDNKITSDIFWMNKLCGMIAKSNIQKEIKGDLISIIVGYRLPVGIITTINAISVSKSEKIAELKKHREVIKKMRFVNGIRSIKGFLMFIKIYLK
ncbi:TPA: glycosyltransferase family 2 protein [Enterococcus faecium]|nr:glycosyltransferase family 2 protein [Enterococcus faecium]